MARAAAGLAVERRASERASEAPVADAAAILDGGREARVRRPRLEGERVRA